ncbi:MFS transporter, partial [Pseudomonas aeruginosa]|nr:MFS transporter [Pseudomonas aeruginosa]
SFFAVALVAVLVGLLVLQLMPAIPGSAGSGSLREELKVFRNAHLWWVYATSLLLIGATFAGFTYFVPILTEVSGFSASTVPLLLVVYGLATLVGNNIVGRLADRHTIAVLAFGLLAAIAAMVAFALFGQVPAVAVAALVVIGLT